MQRSQLVVSRREAGKEVYAANLEHPEAATLEALVASATRSAMPPTSEDETVKRKLVSLGAPLRGHEPLDVAPAEHMKTLLQGVQLAPRDPAVARCLPLCFWRVRDSLDVKTLKALTSRAEDKHSLGFFLELTGELGGDRRLVGLTESFRDRRMTALRDFFQTGRREATRNFDLASKWGFRMRLNRKNRNSRERWRKHGWTWRSPAAKSISD